MIAKVLELLKNNRERGNEEEWKMFYRLPLFAVITVLVNRKNENNTHQRYPYLR